MNAHTHPSFKYIPAVKEERFRSFLGVPIIHRRQLLGGLGVLVVQQRKHRHFDEIEESFMVTLATQMTGILSQSQLNALFSQYRQTRIRALAAATRVAIGQSWVDSSQALPRSGLSGLFSREGSRARVAYAALNESGAEFHRLSKRFTTSAQKGSASRCSIFTAICSMMRALSAIYSRKLTAARWQSKG